MSQGCDFPEPFERNKTLEQIARGHRADVADAQPEQQPRRVGRALGLDRGEQVVDRLVLPAFAFQDFSAFGLEPEDIGRTLQPAEREKLVDGLFPEPLDIERGAAHEMLEPLGPLRRTDQPAGAADIDLTLFGHRLAAALGAMIGEMVGRAGLVAGEVLDHLRDHVAGALDRHAITRAHAEPRDLIAIVQRNVGDHHAAHGHRSKSPDRRQLTRSADLDVDRLQCSLRPLGRELARNRPARRLGHEPQPLLQIEPVDLVDHPIDIIGQVGPGLLDGAVMLQHLCSIGAAHQMRRNRYAPSGNFLHHRELRFGWHRAGRPPAMHQKPQRAARGHTRVLLPQRPRRSIARVGKDLIAALGLRRIERGKVLFRHVNFAANFEQIGHSSAQYLRHIADVRDIGRHILAHLTITPRSRPDQFAMLITERA